MLRVVLGGLALLASFAAFLLTLLIIVHIYSLWALSVGAGEWSLWLGALGLIGIALGFAARSAGARYVLPVTILFGGIAVILSLVPPLQSLPVARSNGVALSLRRYLWGWLSSPPTVEPQTVTFTTVDGRDLDLDVYLPPRSATHPAIVVVHGGSWSGGKRSDFPQWNQWLVRNGYAVFDIDYRLAPQPNWHTATGDVKCAIGWVKQHAAQYTIDPDRVALLGRSAGGHLALLAAYTPDDPALTPSCDAPDTSVQAVIDFYGPADLVWGYNASADPDGSNGSPALQRFLGGTTQTAAEAYRIAAPINHIDARTPPTLILHGNRDQVVGVAHSEHLAAALEQRGGPYQAIYVPYAQHGFDYNFNGWGSQIAQPVLLQFLSTYLDEGRSSAE